MGRDGGGRGSARQRGYSAVWDREAEAFKRDHPLCRGCKARGLIVATEVADHVVPHRGDEAKFWDRSMWQPACRWCHDVVKSRLERMMDDGEIGTLDLWLDSEVAQRVARQCHRRPAFIGSDGWPAGR
jgi:5-methylcytosine-specific restriction protein A